MVKIQRTDARRSRATDQIEARRPPNKNKHRETDKKVADSEAEGYRQTETEQILHSSLPCHSSTQLSTRDTNKHDAREMERWDGGRRRGRVTRVVPLR